MKNTFYLAIALLLYTACKKEDPPPANTVRAMNATETALVGDWILDTTKMYVTNTLIQTTYQSDPINCHLNLTSTPHPTYADNYEGISGLQCVNGQMAWTATPTVLNMAGGQYQIELMTSNNLVLLYGNISSNASRYYLHR